MNVKRVALGTLAYVAVTFPIAVIWHVVIFSDLHHAFGYFAGKPNFLLGFLTIVLQGAILSVLFPLVVLQGIPLIRGLKFAAIIGFFFWTSHVLAFVAKQVVENAPLFVVMESIYLVVQFGVFGVLIGLVYRSPINED